MAALTPALLATLKHAASMANPAFYDRQRRRFSTWGVPRFLHVSREFRKTEGSTSGNSGLVPS